MAATKPINTNDMQSYLISETTRINEINSISTLLPKLIKVYNNSLEVMKALMSSVTSQNEMTTLNIQNFDDNTIDSISIPSFTYFRNCLDRMENNYKVITNANEGDGSQLMLPDGSLRKLVIKRFPQEANNITELEHIHSFNVKENHFFEELINPLMYVNFNVTGKLSMMTERVNVERYILNLNTPDKQSVWNEYFKDSNSISRDEMISICNAHHIEFTIDNEIVDMPASQRKYTGSFFVTKVYETDNGVRQYMIDKTKYTNADSGLPDSMALQTGDSVFVNAETKDTRYKITSITSPNIITLELLEGNDPVEIGTELCIYAPQNTTISSLNVHVPIGFNEYTVIFLKGIDPDSNLLAAEWSPGVGFYSSELKIKMENNSEMSLADYYTKYICDFGSYVLSYAEDHYPTTKQGIKPSAPNLIQDRFQVYLLNGHIYDTRAVQSIQDTADQKAQAFADLNTVNENIEQKQTELAGYAVNSVNYKKTLGELKNLEQNRKTCLETISNSINTLNQYYEQWGLGGNRRKYVIRGFWDMPNEMSNPETGLQSIIQFKVRYRYYSLSDHSYNTVATLNNSDANDNSRCLFPDYNFTETKLRGREKKNGKWIWSDVNMLDSLNPSCNQIQIPINRNEGVEIQVKSVSEAGFPHNCITSDWSNIISIDFPEYEPESSNVYDILEENYNDNSYSKMLNEINARGVYTHIDDSFIKDSIYYTHTAATIASGFIDNNHKPITLLDQLMSMQNTINQLKAEIAGHMGEVKCYVEVNGKTTELHENVTNVINVGTWQDDAKGIGNGGIYKPDVKLIFKNETGTTLRYVSRIIGSDKLINMNLSTDVDYTTYCKYDLASIGHNGFQVAQTGGQWIYFRGVDIKAKKNLYQIADDLTERSTSNYNYYEHSYETGDAFITTPTRFRVFPTNGFTVSNNQLQLNECYYSPGTPLLHNAISFDVFSQDGSMNTQPNVIAKQIITLYNEKFGTSYDVNSDISNVDMINALAHEYFSIPNARPIDHSPYVLNSEYCDITIGTGERESRCNRTVKIGFASNDVYAIGPLSCGSFAYPNVDDMSILKMGESARARKSISNGQTITIPISLEYRMFDYSGMLDGQYADAASNNIQYANVLGFDLWKSLNYDDLSSYDIKFVFKYRKGTAMDPVYVDDSIVNAQAYNPEVPAVD